MQSAPMRDDAVTAPPRPWVVALAVAVSVTAGGIYFAESAGASRVGAFGVGMVSGWAAMLAFAPWRWIRNYNADRLAIRRLAEALAEVDAAIHDSPLSRVLLDRNDDLGRLSQSIHNCLMSAASAHSEVRMLQRSMRDAIERKTRQATAKLEKETSVDALTRVGNRRALDEFVRQLREDAVTISEQSAQTLIALMIDIDYFKEVNDSLGHDAGDDCLVFLGELLRSTVRREDHIVRMGGDEFLVLMRHDSIEAARAIAQRIAALFGQMPWSRGDVARPTLSIGIAEVAVADPHNLEQAVRSADEALYDAKRSGRNRIAVRAVG
ncbi:MAG: GGDEF domain-containing protein [Phycisphaerales bacterium]